MYFIRFYSDILIDSIPFPFHWWIIDMSLLFNHWQSDIHSFRYCILLIWYSLFPLWWPDWYIYSQYWYDSVLCYSKEEIDVFRIPDVPLKEKPADYGSNLVGDTVILTDPTIRYSEMISFLYWSVFDIRWRKCSIVHSIRYRYDLVWPWSVGEGHSTFPNSLLMFLFVLRESTFLTHFGDTFGGEGIPFHSILPDSWLFIRYSIRFDCYSMKAFDWGRRYSMVFWPVVFICVEVMPGYLTTYVGMLHSMEEMLLMIQSKCDVDINHSIQSTDIHSSIQSIQVWYSTLSFWKVTVIRLFDDWWAVTIYCIDWYNSERIDIRNDEEGDSYHSVLSSTEILTTMTTFPDCCILFVVPSLQ